MALGKAVVNILANLAPLMRGLASARLAINKTFKGLATRALTTLRNAINRVTTALTRMAKVMVVSVVAAFVGAIKAAADYQSQLANISTMVDTDIGPTMEMFGNEIDSMSRKYGESTANLAAGIKAILSASLPTAKAVDILTAAMKLAIGGNTDVATANKVLVNTLTAYHMEAGKASEITDKMFASYKRGQFEIVDLAENLGAVTSIAFTAGMSFEQLLATISTVTRNGVAMDQAITGINSVLTAFINPQDAAIKAGKEFGLVVSSNTLRTLGFAEVIKKLAKATAEQQAAIVPNIRGFKAFAAAINDTAGLTADLTLITEDYLGRTETAFEKMSDTAGFEIKRLIQQGIGLGRAFGEPILDPFQNALIELNKKMDRFNAWIKKSRPEIKAFGEALFEALPESLVKRFERLKLDIKIFGTNEAVRKLIGDAVDLMVNKLTIAWEAAKPTFLAMGTFLGEAIAIGAQKALAAAAGNLLPQPRLAAMSGPNYGAGTGLIQGEIRRNYQKDNRRSASDALMPWPKRKVGATSGN